METFLECMLGSLDRRSPGGCRVFEDGDFGTWADRPDQSPPGAMILCRLPDRKRLERTTVIGGDHGCCYRNRVCTHGHPADCLNLSCKNLVDRPADDPGALAIKCGLTGIEIPRRNSTGPECERAVCSQGMSLQMLEQGVSCHHIIVLAPGVQPPSPMFLCMDLLLVRHGEPDWAPDRLVRNDPELTELGQAQATRVAHRLASLDRVDELWVSSMNRAMQTADAIIADLDLDHGHEVYEWLQEINNPPEWEGAPAEEIDRHFKEANTRSMEDMWDGLPGGESFRAFHERVVGGLAETLDSHGIHPMDPDHRHLWTVDDPDRRVIIIAHAGTNAVILGHLLGLDPVPWEWERFRQPHTGVSRLTMIRISTGWAFSLRQLGNVAHLHPGMVTV